jgi:hypothetical protein
MKALRHLLMTSLFCSCISLQNCSLFDFNDKPKTELEKLPPATHTGEGTFGCLVDGKAWVAKSDSWSPPAAKAFYQEGTLSITGINTDIGQTIHFSLYDLNLQEAEYALHKYPDSFGELSDIYLGCEYVTSGEFTGQLIITHLDKVKYIISGTFEFEGYDCGKKVTITKGRFDIKYAP